MEILSASQLQKYDSILEEINKEFLKSEQLKKEIEQQNDKIIALKLSKTKHKISHLTVKVFDSLFEIYNLYDNEVNLSGLPENSNYCLIEVHLTRCLLQKLLASKWKLQVKVSTLHFNLSKILSLSNKTPYFEVIPINSDIKEFTIQACLFLPSETCWNVIDLESINVDVSYHFQAGASKTVQDNCSQLLKISELYSSDIGLSLTDKEIEIESSFPCNITKQEFLNSILLNSYHRLDLESLRKFAGDDEDVLNVQFFVGVNRVLVSYSMKTKIFKMKHCAGDMIPLKKYFYKYCTFDVETVRNKLKILSARSHNLEDASEADLRSYYKDLRKLWL